MEGIELMSVSSVTTICYVIAMVIKNKTAIDNKWIPVICAVLGGIFGVAGFYVMPGFPASDIYNAIVVGIASGLAATGANQIYKQLTPTEETEDA